MADGGSGSVKPSRGGVRAKMSGTRVRGLRARAMVGLSEEEKIHAHEHIDHTIDTHTHTHTVGEFRRATQRTGPDQHQQARIDQGRMRASSLRSFRPSSRGSGGVWARGAETRGRDASFKLALVISSSFFSGGILDGKGRQAHKEGGKNWSTSFQRHLEPCLSACLTLSHSENDQRPTRENQGECRVTTAT